MRRSVAALGAVVLVAMAVVPAGTAASAEDVSISGVHVSPESPVVGEEFTLTADVFVPENVSGSATVTDVYVRGAGGADLARVENAGTAAPGETVPVPLTLSLDDPGATRLRVHAVIEADGETASTSMSTVVDVSRTGEVLLAMPDPGPVAGSTTTLEVGVANGRDDAISSVELELSGDLDLDNPRRVTAAIDARTDRTFTFEADFPDAGEYDLAADLTYDTASGESRTVSRSITVEAVNESESTGLAGDIELTELRTSSGSLVTIEGNAANVGGESVTSVLMRIGDTDRVTPREGSGEYFVGTINASTFQTFELVGTVEGEPPSTVPVVVEYITDGQRRETEFTVDVSSGGGDPARPGGSGNERPNFPTDRMGRQPQPSGPPLGLFGIAIPIVGLLGVGGVGYFVWSRR